MDGGGGDEEAGWSGEFELNLLFNQEPVELMKDGSDVMVREGFSVRVLNQMELMEGLLKRLCCPGRHPDSYPEGWGKLRSCQL